MVAFKKYTGNYIQLVNTLKPLRGIRSIMLSEISMEDYIYELKKDIDRMSYFTNKQSIAELQQKLLNINHLWDHHSQSLRDPLKPFIYSQGDLTGDTFAKRYIAMTAEYLDLPATAKQVGKETSDLCDSLSMAYVDQTPLESNCGICITFFKHIPPGRHTDDGKRPFIISIIQNTNASAIDRNVTCYIHPDLLNLTPSWNEEEISPIDSSQIAQLQDIDSTQLLTDLKTTLNSDELFTFLDGLIIEDSVSPNRLKELKKSLFQRKNAFVKSLLEQLNQIYKFIDLERQNALIAALITQIKQLKENGGHSKPLDKALLNLVPAPLGDLINIEKLKQIGSNYHQARFLHQLSITNRKDMQHLTYQQAPLGQSFVKRNSTELFFIITTIEIAALSLFTIVPLITLGTLTGFLGLAIVVVASITVIIGATSRILNNEKTIKLHQTENEMADAMEAQRHHDLEQHYEKLLVTFCDDLIKPEQAIIVNPPAAQVQDLSVQSPFRLFNKDNQAPAIKNQNSRAAHIHVDEPVCEKSL